MSDKNITVGEIEKLIERAVTRALNTWLILVLVGGTLGTVVVNVFL